MALSILEAAGLAQAAGFSGENLVMVLCIALAESGLNPAATNTQNNTPPSEDRGILQINSYWHPEVSDACAFDAACAFKEGFRISSQGSNFNPWSTFQNGQAATHVAEVTAALGAKPVSLQLTSHGTVCDLLPSNQLDGGSQDKCGPWSVSEVRYAILPNGAGAGPKVGDLIWWAHNEYTKWIGPDVPSDQQGSSIDNMHQFIVDSVTAQGKRNLHYYDIVGISATSQQSSDLARVRAAVRAGYPVIITAAEQSIISKRLGKCPYPWQPRLGNVTHIFTVIGIDGNGDFICGDQLNAFEPWPQVYEAGPIDISWATVIQLVGDNPSAPWLAQIPNTGDPLTWPAGFNAQLFTGGTTMAAVPNMPGWDDDGTTLKDPNGFPLTGAVRTNVLSGWQASNVVMGTLRIDQPDQAVLLEDGRWGKGDLFLFHDNAIAIAWAPDPALTGGVAQTNVTFRIPTGNELFWARRELTDLKAQVATLQAELAACQASSGGIPPAMQTAVNTAVADLQPFVK